MHYWSIISRLARDMGQKSGPKARFIINEHLEVVLEPNGMTQVYIDGAPFIQCMRLLLQIPIADLGTTVIEDENSIDRAAERYETYSDGRVIGKVSKRIRITPEEEFQRPL